MIELQEDNERWQHSVPLDRKYWADNPRYPCTIPPRISKYSQVADDGMVQSQIDIFGKENIGIIDGSMCRIGSFTSTTYAEAPPDVVALLSYCNEIAILLDGKPYLLNLIVVLS